MSEESPADTICINKTKHYLPHPDSKSKYYVCKNGIASVDKCPGNLVFVPANSTCWWPEESDESEDTGNSHEIVSDIFRFDFEAEFMNFPLSQF